MRQEELLADLDHVCSQWSGGAVDLAVEGAVTEIRFGEVPQCVAGLYCVGAVELLLGCCRQCEREACVDPGFVWDCVLVQ